MHPLNHAPDADAATTVGAETVPPQPQPLTAGRLDTVRRHVPSAHPGANRAEKRAAWRRYRRYAARPVAPDALVET